jgi:hypothetical protein
MNALSVQASLPTLMSVANSGGQGKTTVAQLLNIAAKKRGSHYRLYAADFQNESGTSKLGKLYPDQVRELGAGAALTAARNQNNANAPLRYWDALGPILLEGHAIVDVGANVISQIIQWGVDRHVAALMERRRSPRIDIVCVCRAQSVAYDDVRSLIGGIVSQKPFRFGKIIIARNEFGGPFQPSFERDMINAFPDVPLTFLTIPACQAEIWPSVERVGVSLESIVSKDEDELIDLLDVDLWTAASGLAEVRAWVDHCVHVIHQHEIV